MKDLLVNSQSPQFKGIDMKKLNEVIYKKLVLQAEEAKELGLNKLGNAVLSSVGATPREVEEKITVTAEEMKEKIYTNLWKAAMEVLVYHDLESADIQKLDDTIAYLTDKFVLEVQGTLDVEDIGKLEPKLPGETE